MNSQHIRSSLIIIALVIMIVLVFSLAPSRNDDQRPESSTEVANDKTRSGGDEDPEISPESADTGGRMDQADDQSKGVAANLEDITKASTAQFPIWHSIKNGLEWIQAAEMEEYLVLKTTEPPLQAKDIKGVQMVLKSLKMYSGDMDGIYDADTVAAVKAFQQFYGLKSTGVVDLDDYNLLARVYEETIPSVAAPKTKPKGNISVLVILDERTLYVLEDGKLFYKFPVAVGTVDTPSPIGTWKIVSKDSWGEGFGTRWMGFNVPYGKFGIHGTNQPWSVGRAESHGCFRMFNRDIEVLYNWVTWGTKVVVAGGQFPYNTPWRTIRDGDRGSDVWLIQNRLKELGYLNGRPDGIYGQWTKQLVMRYQKERQLPVTGEVDWATRNKMGFYDFQ